MALTTVMTPYVPRATAVYFALSLAVLFFRVKSSGFR